jgi:hypothetical protein
MSTITELLCFYTVFITVSGTLPPDRGYRNSQAMVDGRALGGYAAPMPERPGESG